MSTADKPVIGIDIDDVLAANAEGFVAWSNKRLGMNLRPEDYEEHWSKVWKMQDMEEVERLAVEFHADGVVAGYHHYDAALQVLRELKKDYKLYVFTSRRLSIEKLTREWIEEHYSGIFDEILFAGIWDKPLSVERVKLTKADLFATNKVKFVIDDQLKHCIAAAEKGIQALLFGDYPWNRTSDQLPALVTRVADWDGVRRYFDGK